MKIETVAQETIQYNPQSNTFEARVTLITEGGTYRYPCAVKGPLIMPLAMAAFKLTQQAKERHAQRKGLRTRLIAPATTAADEHEEIPLLRAA